jgi:glycosyltransferase involved in cell wall biosynthesis
MRILIEAYECDPYRGHAPGSAWASIIRLSKWNEISVITESTQYRDGIQRYIDLNPDATKNLRFFYIANNERVRKRTSRATMPVIDVLAYRWWLWKSYTLAKKLHEETPFDLTHHLRGNSFRDPGYLWRLPIPFVWGPTGGTGGVSFGLMTFLPPLDRIRHLARRAVSSYQLNFSRRVGCALKRAATVFAQTSSDASLFARVARQRVALLHEQSCDDIDGRRGVVINDGEPIKLVWVGRCIPLKAFPILLETLGEFRQLKNYQLHVAGDGPSLSKWRYQATKLGLDNRITWHGWLTQDATLQVLSNSHLLVFTSLWEATSATVMQSLSLGIPVLCLNRGGYSDVIDESCGFKIEADDRYSTLRGFADVLNRVLEAPKILEALSDGALRRARELTWDNTARRIQESYSDAVERGPAKV